MKEWQDKYQKLIKDKEEILDTLRHRDSEIKMLSNDPEYHGKLQNILLSIEFKHLVDDLKELLDQSE